MGRGLIDGPTPRGADVPQPAARSSFRRSLSWSLVGGLGAGATLFLLSIYAGRVLGPAEFGRFSFVQSAAMVLLIPALAGFDLATSRALTRDGRGEARSRITASAMVAVACCSVLTGTVVVVFSDPLAAALDTDGGLLALTAVFAALLAQRWLLERVLSGLGRFRAQAAVRLAEAAAVVTTFVALRFAADVDDYRALVGAYCVGAVVVVVGAWGSHQLRLRPRHVRWGQVRQLLVYGGLMNASYLFATLLFQADRVAVNAVLGSRDLGIYTAYYSATIFIVIQLLLIVSNVLFPAMSAMDDKTEFLRQLDARAPYALVVGAGGLLLSLGVVLALFGDAYPFRWSLAAPFATWAALAACNGVYAIVVNAHSERSCARELAFQPVRLAFVITWFVALGATAHLTLETAVLGVLAGELLEAVNLRLVLRTHVRTRTA